jgi:hypothetical protein
MYPFARRESIRSRICGDDTEEGAHMHTVDWIVIAAGLCAVAWVNWYFFLAEDA